MLAIDARRAGIAVPRSGSLSGLGRDSRIAIGALLTSGKPLAAGRDPEQAVTVGRFRYAALGKAQATGDITGLFKVIADAVTGRVLGAHIVGAHAADLIHEAALAMETGATVSQIARMIHAHPTLAEGFGEALEDVEGCAIHQMKKKA